MQFDVATLDNAGDYDGYVVSPNRLNGIVEEFLGRYAKLNNAYLSVSTLGSDLNSDFNEKAPVSRSEAQEAVTEAIRRLSGAGSLLTETGNAYALPYVDHVLNLPYDNSHFRVASTTVPFVQMVLHGYVEYGGEPMNLSENYTENLLKTIEVGGGLYYILNAAPSSVVKDTVLSSWYSTQDTVWMDSIREQYAAANTAYKQTAGACITRHTWLTADVAETLYDNGAAVCVNYGETAYTWRGKTVDAGGVLCAAQNGEGA